MAKRLKSWLWGYCCDLKKQDATGEDNYISHADGKIDI